MLNNEITKSAYHLFIGTLLSLVETGACHCLCGDGGSNKTINPSEIIEKALGKEMTIIVKTLSEHVYGDSCNRNFLSLRLVEETSCAPLVKVVEVIEMLAKSNLVKII